MSFVNPRRVPQMAGAEEIMAALPAEPGRVRIGLVLNERGWDRAASVNMSKPREWRGRSKRPIIRLCLALPAAAGVSKFQTSLRSPDVSNRIDISSCFDMSHLMCSSPLAVHAEPPDLLHLASHPVRWPIMRALARSDCKVQELTELVGEPQNLVSFHLGKLRSGELVAARRSSADRRDCYYTLNLTELRSLISEAGAALHPGLRLVPTATVAPAPRPTKILFLCTGNSARSQIAEALVKARSGGVIKAYSAGSAPKPLHPNTIRAMCEAYGLDLSGQKSKHLERFAERHFDCVVSLCDRLREICPDFPGSPETIHWSIENPASDEPDAATYARFETVAAEISRRVDFLLAALPDPAIPIKAREKA